MHKKKTDRNSSILVTQLASMVNRFSPMNISAWNGLSFAEAPPYMNLDLTFKEISVHLFRIIPQMRHCCIMNQNSFITWHHQRGWHSQGHQPELPKPVNEKY